VNEKITEEEVPQGTAILLGDRSMMVVTDADAAAVGRPRVAVAGDYARRFRQAIEQARDRQSVRWLVLGVIKSLLATAALLAALVLLRVLRRRALRALEAVQEGGAAGVRSWRSSSTASPC
jgi:hypothetical protein